MMTEDIQTLIAAVLVVAQSVNRIAENQGVIGVPNVIEDLETMLRDVKSFAKRPPNGQ